ncbi:unnamed protein product [Ixodes persulcatus]
MGSKTKSFLDRPLKRGRTEETSKKASPTMPVITFRKFLVMRSENDDQPLSKLSPFLVAKTLENVIGKDFKAKKLPSGDLLVEVTTAKQSTALLALNEVREYKVSVTPYRSLNSTQGVISEDYLLEIPTDEIVEGLSGQGVVSV